MPELYLGVTMSQYEERANSAARQGQLLHSARQAQKATRGAGAPGSFVTRSLHAISCALHLSDTC